MKPGRRSSCPCPQAARPLTTTEPLPSAFLVHRLEQSRPVRSGRMEYFDGPVLGVLAWLSDISDTIVEQETASSAACRRPGSLTRSIATFRAGCSTLREHLSIDPKGAPET